MVGWENAKLSTNKFVTHNIILKIIGFRGKNEQKGWKEQKKCHKYRNTWCINAIKKKIYKLFKVRKGQWHNFTIFYVYL